MQPRHGTPNARPMQEVSAEFTVLEKLNQAGRDPTPLNQLDAEHTAVRPANSTGQKCDSTGFPVARTQDRSRGLLVRVLTVASLAQTTATHSPGQMLPVGLVPEFDVCAARFHLAFKLHRSLSGATR